MCSMFWNICCYVTFQKMVWPLTLFQDQDDLRRRDTSVRPEYDQDLSKHFAYIISNFDVLLTMHLSIFISVINQLHAQNICVKIILFHAYRCDDTRGCVMQFWPPDDEHTFSKHVEAWNKLIVKQKFCASSWLITEINMLYQLLKTSTMKVLLTVSIPSYNICFTTNINLITDVWR